jgi:hypothetical protein
MADEENEYISVVQAVKLIPKRISMETRNIYANFVRE